MTYMRPSKRPNFAHFSLNEQRFLKDLLEDEMCFETQNIFKNRLSYYKCTRKLKEMGMIEVYMVDDNRVKYWSLTRLGEKLATAIKTGNDNYDKIRNNIA